MGIMARLRMAKIQTMPRPDLSDKPLKRTKTVRSNRYMTNHPIKHEVVIKEWLCSILDIAVYGGFLRNVPCGSQAGWCIDQVKEITGTLVKDFKNVTSHSLSFFISESLNATPKRMLCK